MAQSVADIVRQYAGRRVLSHIPVYPAEHLAAEPPDYVVILAWNFAREIVAFLQPCRERGTRFVLPIPEPRVI